MITSLILDLARTHLNDDNAINWPDSNLLPKLQEAHRELQMELELSGIPVIDEVTAILTVDAGDTDFTQTTGYPTDLIVPVQLKERQVGGVITDFVDMSQTSFVPNVLQTTRLNYWSWMGEKILFIGATVNVEVQLRYQRGLPIPTRNTDTVDFLFAELFLSHRTASLAFNAAANYDRGEVEKEIALANLTKVIQMNVNRTVQTMPAKRRAYHRSMRQSNIVRGI